MYRERCFIKQGLKNAELANGQVLGCHDAAGAADHRLHSAQQHSLELAI